MSPTEFRSASYLLPVLWLGLFSNILFITNIFRHIFLSYHVSQLLQTWYGASTRGPTHCLLNSGLPVIYFLFYNLVYFQTWHGNVANFHPTLLGYTKWVPVIIHRFLVVFGEEAFYNFAGKAGNVGSQCFLLSQCVLSYPLIHIWCVLYKYFHFEQVWILVLVKESINMM